MAHLRWFIAAEKRFYAQYIVSPALYVIHRVVNHLWVHIPLRQLIFLGNNYIIEWCCVTSFSTSHAVSMESVGTTLKTLETTRQCNTQSLPNVHHHKQTCLLNWPPASCSSYRPLPRTYTCTYRYMSTE